MTLQRNVKPLIQVGPVPMMDTAKMHGILPKVQVLKVKENVPCKVTTQNQKPRKKKLSGFLLL